MTVENTEFNPVPWPNKVTEEDLYYITNFRNQGRSLAASVALRIINEAESCKMEESEMFNRYETDKPDDLIIEAVKQFHSWNDYVQPAYALLNAEEFLKNGVPLQDPSQKWETILMRSSMLMEAVLEWEKEKVKEEDYKLRRQYINDYLDTKMVPVFVEWYLREQSLVSILRDNDPLKFIDIITPMLNARNVNLVAEFAAQREEALKQGRLRFHQLYQAVS